MRPLLHALYEVRHSLTPAKAAPKFEDSVLARLAVPLRQLGVCFAVLYVFDNAMSLAALLGTTIDHSTPLIAGFPDACYTTWAGYAALFCQHEWFSRRGNSQGQLMAQRAWALATVSVTAAAATYLLGLNPASLLAIGGMAGFASSLAIKDVLTNLFAGVTLALQRPFSEGDEVIFGTLTATVVKLGYFRTVLRDADSHIIYMPNGLFINQAIANAGRGTHTRVTGPFVLRYEDAPRLEAAMTALEEALCSMQQVDAPSVSVTCAGYGPAGIKVKLDALFRRGALSSDAVTSAAWLLVGRVVAQQGCAFASPLLEAPAD